MRSPLVSIVAALIVFAFAGAAYYYWVDGGGDDEPVLGIVVGKAQRESGTEAGDNSLQQGMNLLTGQSLDRPMFYFIRVETEDGAEVELKVSKKFYEYVLEGDSVEREAPDGDPVILSGE